MFELETMDNGMRLLTADNPQSPSATALVMFGVGSRFERQEECGIAHFAEHMFFKGTERRPTAHSISVEIDGIGGDFNAFTGKEYTGYYVKCASEHLPLAVDVLTDMLLNSLFDADEINREKGVILEEMNMYRDTPARYVGNVYDNLLYGNQPLGWDIIGTEDVIKGADRDLFRGFIDRWYTANRCVAGLAGAVSPEALSLMRERFTGIGAANDGDCDMAVWEQGAPQVRLHHKESEQAHLVVGLRAPGYMDEDRYALSVLNAILGSGMSSRLFTEIRERLGLCYYVYSHHDANRETGSLAVHAGVDVDRVDLAVGAIVKEVWKILSHKPAQEELEKARNYLKGRFVLGIEDTRGLIMFGARKEVVEGQLREPAEILAEYDAVTMDDVLRVAERLRNPDHLNLAVVGPFQGEEHRFEGLLRVGAAAGA